MADDGFGFGLVFTRFKWISVAVFLLVFFIIGIDEALGARGTRFGGYRSSSTRYVRSSSSVRVNTGTRVRVRYNTYRPWRSWHSYGSTGHIYGFVWYTRTRHYYSNRDREPTICRNEYDNYMDNGTNYEWFICPNITSPDNFDSCCGDEDRQYCCKSSLSGAQLFGVVVAVILFGIFMFLFFYCCCCRKTTGQRPMFQERFMSKRQTPLAPVAAVHYRPNINGASGNPAEMTHLVNPPMKGPTATFPQSDQPMYPPMPPTSEPAYPPQPIPGYQNGGYPMDGNPAQYAPYPPLPAPDSNQSPYPLQPPNMNAGYPPVSAPPYPSDGISAPPYPVDGGAAPPYPPYPSDGSAAPPYPSYPSDGSTAPPYPPNPSGGSSAPPYPGAGSAMPPYPPNPAGFNPQDYPASPPPTYANMK